MNNPVQFNMHTLYCIRRKFPVGNLFLIADEDALLSISFNFDSFRNDLFKMMIFTKTTNPGQNTENEILKLTLRELDDYFARKRKNFSIPLKLSGTNFQMEVWKALQEIPYATVVSYKDIAVKIGKPNAGRAVGSANGKNHIPIIIPCHRVINSSGELGGYGGGLDIKKYLLSLEQRN